MSKFIDMECTNNEMVGQIILPNWEDDSLVEVNHPNVLRLLAKCTLFFRLCSHTVETPMINPESKGYIFAEIRERLLCFEYIINGSLDTKITDEFRGLDWDKHYHIIQGICTLVIKIGKKALLKRCFKKVVMLELTGGDCTTGRPGLDLVAVVDVSGSMDRKMEQLNNAMRFVVLKLSLINRLSIITFFGESARCGRSPRPLKGNCRSRVLNTVACNSMGGMFSRIRPNWLLTLAFTQCLAGLLTVAVRDLELKVEAVEYESKLLQGTARSYPLTHGGDLVSFRFGNHYSRATSLSACLQSAGSPVWRFSRSHTHMATALRAGEAMGELWCGQDAGEGGGAGNPLAESRSTGAHRDILPLTGQWTQDLLLELFAMKGHDIQTLGLNMTPQRDL